MAPPGGLEEDDLDRGGGSQNLLREWAYTVNMLAKTILFHWQVGCSNVQILRLLYFFSHSITYFSDNFLLLLSTFVHKCLHSSTHIGKTYDFVVA